MPNPPQNLQEVFDRLIETNLDSQIGFKAAAAAVNDPTVRAQLMSHSQEHARLVQELKGVAANLGLAPLSGQTRALPPHMRGWLTLKHALATNDGYAILAECEMSLAKTVECYQSTLSAGLPHWVAYFLSAQALQAEQAHSRVSHMCAIALSLLPPRRPGQAAAPLTPAVYPRPAYGFSPAR